IKALDNGLTDYWRYKYPDDPVIRVYVVYFFESAFQSPPDPEPFHLHIHIISRFQSLNKRKRLRTLVDGSSCVDGWKMPRLAPKQRVPRAYGRCTPGWDDRARDLMTYLRKHPELAACQKELIAARAHAIWEREGRQHGRDVEHWFRAEQEIAAENAAAVASAM